MSYLKLSKAALLLLSVTVSCSMAVMPADEEINAMIGKHRMADMIIKTRPGARVEVTQTRHAFLFGTCLSDMMWAEWQDFEFKRNWSPDLKYLEDPAQYEMIRANRQKYFQIVKDNFNYAVHRNCAKWYITEYEGPGSVYYTPADRIYLWCKQNNIPMRGHCVFWGIKQYNLPWAEQMESSELLWRMQSRAHSVMSRYRGYIDEWDLNNEMIHNRWYRDRLGEDVVDKMFAWAKEANPDSVLYLNEYDVIDGKVTDKYVDMINDFRSRGLPVEGIGCQAHFYSENINFDKISDSLDKLSKLGLPIKITEVSMSVKDEKLKAKLLDKFLRLCYSKPAVEAIVFWGFWEEIHWLPHAGLWTKDWTATPAAEAYRNLVFNQWWTQSSGVADRNGIYRLRGFLGDYTVKVAADGFSKTSETRLDETGATVNIQ